MALDKKSIDMAVESVKDFFKNLLNPNMTLEDIADVASPRLDELIQKHEEKGLAYSAGKFHIKYADDKHFQLEFEMYFKDKEGNWYFYDYTNTKTYLAGEELKPYVTE